MINEKTVFILGAGASLHAGFPTGVELRNIILDAIEKFNKNKATPLDYATTNGGRFDKLKLRGKKIVEFQRFLEDSGITYDLAKEFGVQLKYSQLYSVDAFLERRREYISVGKKCMAYAISNMENVKILYRNPNWYQYIFNKINADFEDFDKNEVSFITYNYDRSLELYLFNAILSTYGKPANQCIEKMNKIQIIHLHGKLGDLDFSATHNNLNYGGQKTSVALSKEAESINIIHDNVDENVDFTKAHKLFDYAKKIIFLGFGYNQINIDRLKLSDLPDKKITGSTIGLRVKEIEEIISKNPNFDLEFNPYTDCEDYLRNEVILK